MSSSPALQAALLRETARPLPSAVAAMTRSAQEQFGEAVQAVLFYGSCRRIDDPDGLYDLYVVLDDYATLPRLECWLARLLPPNVYYLEYGQGGNRRRAKSTVISQRDFERGTSPRWFHSYLWGRFSQPVSLAYARDDAVQRGILDSLGNAVQTFLSRTVGLCPSSSSIETLWVIGLRASYAAELRNEGPDRAAELFRSQPDYYSSVTRAVADALDCLTVAEANVEIQLSEQARRRARAGWALRRLQGKLLSLARIFKAWYTFDGGLDYIVWKLARHADKEIEIPERVRRKPWLYLWGFFWRLYREGVFR